MTEPLAEGGRVHAYNWQFNVGSYAVERSIFTSFYARVPGGLPGTEALIELKLDGLSGYYWDLNANRFGVDGPDRGRSVPTSGNSVTPEFPLYLNPPSLAAYGAVTPTVSDFALVSGNTFPVYEDGDVDCNMIVSGVDTYDYQFRFTTDVEASYHVQCDLDQDGVFDPMASGDLLLIGWTVAGENTVDWDGETNAGVPIEPGAYDCQVRVNVGEFHYVGRDIETSYQGMRMYEVLEDSSRVPLAMRWNDSAVQGNALSMPNGQLGLERPTVGGVDPGPIEDDALANENARAWGDFVATGKGNNAFLDTYTWTKSDISSVFEVASVPADADADADGLSDYQEACLIGTSPDNPDTDGDGTPDGEEFDGDYQLDRVTVFFEDMIGPGQNDWDYNDFVVELESVETLADGGVERIELSYTPLARGAGYIHELHQRVGGVTGSWTATVQLEGESPQMFAGTGDVDLLVYADTRDALPPYADTSYTNTGAQPDWLTGVPAKVTIELSSPGLNPANSFDPAPYDLYLRLPYIALENKEIHTPDYAGQTEQTAKPSSLAGGALDFAIVSRAPAQHFWPCEGYAIWTQFDMFEPYVLALPGAPSRDQVLDRPTAPANTWSRQAAGACAP